MICIRDQIRYQNVLSKRYEFHYSQMDEFMREFLTEVEDAGGHPKDILFYCINNVPREERLKVEFFLPVREDFLQATGDMHFHSYFSIENMMSIRVTDKIETSMEGAYAALLHFMEEADLEQVTPPFHMIGQAAGNYFITVKIGYIEKQREVLENVNQ